MMAIVKVTVQLDDGRELSGGVYTIYATRLGWYLNNRYFVANLELRDDADQLTEFAPLLKVESAEEAVAFHQHLVDILSVLGLQYWEQVVGSRVIGLFRGEGSLSGICGIASLDGSRVYLAEKPSDTTSG